MSLILALLYPIAVQYERGGWWYLLAPVTLTALLIDVIVTHTELVLIFGWPAKNEWTFSTALLRLRYEGGWRGKFARLIVQYLNYFAPNGKHV